MSMDSDQWLAYFKRNEGRPSPQTPSTLTPLHPALQAPLVRALQCFQLGEAGEGRVAQEAARSADPALNEAMKISVGLYVREEGRHARELAQLLRAMGEPTIKQHLFESLFEQSRRLLGLRAKMAVIAVAEVVGSTFYSTVAARVSCPHVAEVARVIGADEDRHLEFQRDYFKRVLLASPFPMRPVLAVILAIWFLSVLIGAIASVAIGHRALFIALGIGPFRFGALCLQRLWRLSASISAVGCLATGNDRYRADHAGAAGQLANGCRAPTADPAPTDRARA
jgi:hypothetical protein